MTREVEANTPIRCPKCDGQGRVFRYRIDDHRYPIVCKGCNGSGIAVWDAQQGKWS